MDSTQVVQRRSIGVRATGLSARIFVPASILLEIRVLSLVFLLR